MNLQRPAPNPRYSAATQGTVHRLKGAGIGAGTLCERTGLSGIIVGEDQAVTCKSCLKKIPPAPNPFYKFGDEGSTAGGITFRQDIAVVQVQIGSTYGTGIGTMDKTTAFRMRPDQSLNLAEHFINLDEDSFEVDGMPTVSVFISGSRFNIVKVDTAKGLDIFVTLPIEHADPIVNMLLGFEWGGSQ